MYSSSGAVALPPRLIAARAKTAQNIVAKEAHAYWRYEAVKRRRKREREGQVGVYIYINKEIAAELGTCDYFKLLNYGK